MPQRIFSKNKHSQQESMRIDIITALPELIISPFSHSIMKRAQQKEILQLHLHDLRDYGQGKHKQIDDYQYGGGAGMVLMIEPLATVIEHLLSKNNYDEVIYLTPDGEKMDQGICNQLSLNANLMMICGHYKGIDQRVRDLYVTKEISIGDFVISGGEMAAALLTDAIVRLIPGVLNDETSALFDSFQDQMLAPPVYTRPADFRGNKVPDVLLSGNQHKIEEWRDQESFKRTIQRRPDLLKK